MYEAAKEHAETKLEAALCSFKCYLDEDIEKVHKIYTNYGFKDFQHDGEHQQFFKLIN